MSSTLQALGIDRMSFEERLALVQELWDTIASAPPRPLLTESQRQELARRIADDQAHPDDVIPWDQIKADALARFQR